jgi:hypothetical protein
MYHNIAPFLDIADLVIGDVSAATSAAFYYKDKPVLLVKDKKFVATSSFMNSASCNIISMKDLDSIPREVESCLKNPLEKSKAREDYFKVWYGTVDGSEGLRFIKERMNG